LLRRIARHPEEAAEKALAARERVCERLTWQHTAARMHERLEILARQPARRPPHPPSPPLPQGERGEQELCLPLSPLWERGPGGEGARRPRVSLCIIARNE